MGKLFSVRKAHFKPRVHWANLNIFSAKRKVSAREVTATRNKMQRKVVSLLASLSVCLGVHFTLNSLLLLLSLRFICHRRRPAAKRTIKTDRSDDQRATFVPKKPGRLLLIKRMRFLGTRSGEPPQGVYHRKAIP